MERSTGTAAADRAAGASGHEGRRAALAIVSDVAAVVDLLAETGVLDPSLGWRRHFGRFHGDAEPWASIVLESPAAPMVHLQIGDVRPAATTTGQVLEVPSLAAFVAVERFPHDPAYPALGAVLDALDDVRIIRYRPGSRCTLSASSGGVPRFVKVTTNAWRIQRDALALWGAYTEGAIGTAVAEPLAFDPATFTVEQGVVAGSPIVAEVLGADGPAWSHRLGRALGELSSAPLTSDVVIDGADQIARTGRAVARAIQRVPALTEGLGRVMAHLQRRHDALVDRPLLPVHGSPHLHQWLADGDRLGLVDFDRFGVGDPELDIATYLAELDFEKGLIAPIAEHERAIVSGFEQACRPLDPERMDLYRLHKRVAKVSRTTFALRADGDRRAAAHLDKLLASL